MNINNESDLILILQIKDKKQTLRASQCIYLKVRVFTTDERYGLIFTKTDIETKDDKDLIVIGRDDLEKLESGVVRYIVEFKTMTDVDYQKSQVVVTDFYFANDAVDFDHPENIINYKTIERLKEAIEKCGADCRIELEKLRTYITEEYTNKLDEEIRRSTDVDIRFFELVKELQDKAADSGADITEINDAIEDIKRQLNEHDIHLNALDDKFLSLKSRTEAVYKDLDFRLDKAETKLNTLFDSNENTGGSLSNTLKKAREYADELLKEANKFSVSEEEFENFKKTITPHPTRLSEFQNDCGYISNWDILGNYYTRQQVEEKLDVERDRLSDIENSYVRQDEVTVVKDENGELIRELVISSEPEYYTKEEADELHNSLKDEYENSFDRVDSSLSEIIEKHNTDIEKLNTDIDAYKKEHDEDIKRLDETISETENSLKQNIEELSDKHTQDVNNLTGLIKATEENLNSSLTEYKEEMSGILEDLDNTDSSLSDRITGLENNFNSKFDEINSSVNSKFEEIENDVDNRFNDLNSELGNLNSSLTGEIEELKQLHIADKSEIDSSITGLRELIDSLDSSVNDKFNSVNEIIDDIVEDISDIEKDIEDKFGDLNDKLGNLNSSLTGEIEELKQQHIADKSEIDSSITGLLATIDELNSSVNNKFDEVDSSISELIEADSSLDKRITEMEETVGADTTYNVGDISVDKKGWYSTEDDECMYVNSGAGFYLTNTEFKGYNYFKIPNLPVSKEGYHVIQIADSSFISDATWRKNGQKYLDASYYSVGDLVKINPEANCINVGNLVGSGISGTISVELNNKTGLVSKTGELDDRLTLLEEIDHNSFALNSSLVEFEEDFNGKVTEINSSISVINSSISDINSSLVDHETRIKSLEEFDHSVYAIKDDVNSSLNELTGLITDVSNSVAEIDFTPYATNASVNQYVADIDSSIGDLSTRIKSLEEFDHSVYALKSDVNSSFVDIEKKITDVSNSVDAIDLSPYLTIADASEIYGKIWKGTRDAYDRLGSYNDKTIYCITN